MLDQEPLRFSIVLAAHPHERERALEPLAVERDLHVAAFVAPAEVVDVSRVGFVGAAVPEHDRPAAVFTGGNRSLERVVLDGVILDFHREPSLRRVERRALRDGPALHHAVELEAKVVMELTRGVLLDHEPQRSTAGARRRPSHITRRLRRSREVALRLILAERPARLPRACRPLSCRHALLLRSESWLRLGGLLLTAAPGAGLPRRLCDTLLVAGPGFRCAPFLETRL